MLAIIILVGVFYLALNYAEKSPSIDPSCFSSESTVKSFKDNERQIDERIDVSVRSKMTY